MICLYAVGNEQVDVMRILVMKTFINYSIERNLKNKYN